MIVKSSYQNITIFSDLIEKNKDRNKLYDSYANDAIIEIESFCKENNIKFELDKYECVRDWWNNVIIFTDDKLIEYGGIWKFRKDLRQRIFNRNLNTLIQFLFEFSDYQYFDMMFLHSIVKRSIESFTYDENVIKENQQERNKYFFNIRQNLISDFFLDKIRTAKIYLYDIFYRFKMNNNEIKLYFYQNTINLKFDKNIDLFVKEHMESLLDPNISTSDLIEEFNYFNNDKYQKINCDFFHVCNK